MIDRVQTCAAALERYVRGGQVLMVGGFGRGGTPFTLLGAIADQGQHLTGLTLIKNDGNEPDLGIGRLIAGGQVRRLIATHLGLNPDCIARMHRGELAVELVPQGIFAERIRAGGAGIPGFLSDIGLGTEVAQGKPTVELDGKHYLLETALRGDVALLAADVVDRTGNCWWRGSNRNMNPLMGTACTAVIVEAKQIVAIGAVAPEEVQLAGAFVDAVVQAEPRRPAVAERTGHRT